MDIKIEIIESYLILATDENGKLIANEQIFGDRATAEQRGAELKNQLSNN